MKNKKTLYILVPLVALIWGLILWKVFAYRPSGEKEMAVYDQGAVQAEEDTLRYEVQANYRDPFLRASARTSSTAKAGSKKRENNIKKVKIHSVQGVSKPDNLVYHGLIEGRNDKVGLLELGSRQMLVEEDCQVEDYRILAVEADSLRISYQEKVFTYGRQ